MQSYRLFAYHEKNPPTVVAVNQTWQMIVAEEKSDAIKEISLLSIGQKQVLASISSSVKKLAAKENMMALKMAPSSISVALEGLEAKDIIERNDTLCQIINPVVKYYVVKAS